MPNSRNSGKKDSRSRTDDNAEVHISSGNVFKDLGFNDEEANKKLMKCQLMIEIERIIKSNGWTQAEAARRLCVAQPRISELMTTRIERFTIDMLLKYLHRLGKQVQLVITNPDVA